MTPRYDPRRIGVRLPSSPAKAGYAAQARLPSSPAKAGYAGQVARLSCLSRNEVYRGEM